MSARPCFETISLWYLGRTLVTKTASTPSLAVLHQPKRYRSARDAGEQLTRPTKADPDDLRVHMTIYPSSDWLWVDLTLCDQTKDQEHLRLPKVRQQEFYPLGNVVLHEPTRWRRVAADLVDAETASRNLTELED